MSGANTMRFAVKTLVAVIVMTMVAIRPDADAALSPYSPAVAPQTDPIQFTIFNPYPNEQAGIFQSFEIAPMAVPSLMKPETPLAMIAPQPAVAPIDTPEQSANAPVVAQPAIAPEPLPVIGALEKVPPTGVPDAAPGEAFAAPRERAANAEPREVPSRRQAVRPPSRVDVLRIKFAGPTLTPFAHIRFCIKYASECRVHKMLFRGGAIKLTAERRQELIRINADVNRSIIATRVNETVAEEKWLISPKAGDCNDYAVTKRHKLIARGWPARVLLLAEVVTSWGEHHLVLVVRTSQGDLVADNLNANIRNWSKTPYEWVRVESPTNPTFWSKIEAPQPDVVAMAGRDRQL
jgi:predicted transglutaminase-like cysteine proteinase